MSMMRKVDIVKVLFSFLILFILPSYSADKLKVGVVDVEQIYSSYEKAKATTQDIKTKREAKQAELNKKQAELQALVDEYNKKKDSMKDTEKKEYEKKIQEKRTEVISFTRKTNEQLAAENKKEVQARLTEIANVIQDYAKKNGYDLIIDKKSLPFFSDALNITSEIIKALNKK